jgi:cytochrome c5
VTPWKSSGAKRVDDDDDAPSAAAPGGANDQTLGNAVPSRCHGMGTSSAFPGAGGALAHAPRRKEATWDRSFAA